MISDNQCDKTVIDIRYVSFSINRKYVYFVEYIMSSLNKMNVIMTHSLY